MTLVGSLIRLAQQDLSHAMGRLRRNLVVAALASVLLLTAYGAAIAAIAIHLAATEGPVAAAIVISLGTLTLAVLAIAYVTIRNRMDRRRPMATAMRLRAVSQEAGAELAYRLTDGKPLAALATVGLLAFAVTRMSKRA